MRQFLEAEKFQFVDVSACELTSDVELLEHPLSRIFQVADERPRRLQKQIHRYCTTLPLALVPSFTLGQREGERKERERETGEREREDEDVFVFFSFSFVTVLREREEKERRRERDAAALDRGGH